MIAVAYQFQDATPGASTFGTSLSTIDPSELIGQGQKLSTDMGGIVDIANNTIGTAGSVLESSTALTDTSTSFASLIENSGINKSLQALESSLVPALNSSDPTAATAKIDVSRLKDNFTKLGSSGPGSLNAAKLSTTSLTDDMKTKLSAASTSGQDQTKLVSSKADIAKFKASVDTFAAGIPASKAKSWRDTGAEKDSQGNSGSLYFNAGKYAVKTLAADL